MHRTGVGGLHVSAGNYGVACREAAYTKRIFSTSSLNIPSLSAVEQQAGTLLLGTKARVCNSSRN